MNSVKCLPSYGFLKCKKKKKKKKTENVCSSSLVALRYHIP